MHALARQDAAVEDVDRRSSRAHREKDRPLLDRRPARLLSSDPVVGSGASSDRLRRREGTVRVGQVEDGRRRPGNIEDRFQHSRAEALQVVDRGGRRQDRVDRSLDVALLERPPAVLVGGRRAIELPAELADLVAGRFEEPGRRPIGCQIRESSGGGHRGRKDAAVHVGEQPEKSGEDQSPKNHEGGGRGIAGAGQAALGNRLAASEPILQLEKDVAQRSSGGLDDVVPLLARRRGISRHPQSDRAVGRLRVELFGRLCVFERAAGTLREDPAANRSERSAQRRAAAVVSREVVALARLCIAVERVFRFRDRGLRVADPLAQIGRPLNVPRDVVKRQHLIDRVIQPRRDNAEPHERGHFEPRLERRTRSRGRPELDRRVFDVDGF